MTVHVLGPFVIGIASDGNVRGLGRKGGLAKAGVKISGPI